jgi:SAM-dependent methyltransferase
VSCDPDEQRRTSRENWQRAAPGWGRQADHLRQLGMPVSVWMVDHLGLQPGQEVLELAAGPGDTGFLAAELIKPGGRLITSDGSEAMLAVARERARSLGVENVEFRQLELEWIDLPAAGVDAALCRWGIMLCVDPLAAVRECRRVLRPGGRFALAVWDEPTHNRWATIPGDVLVDLGHAEPPDRSAPGPFSLSAPGRLEELLGEGGFTDVMLTRIDIARAGLTVDAYLAEQRDLSRVFSDVWDRISSDERADVVREITRRAEPFTASDGLLLLPGRTLAAAATA